MKTSELIGPALDWAVAKCEGVEVEYIDDSITRCLLRGAPFTGWYSPSTLWAQGGPLIESEAIGVGKEWDGATWLASAHHIDAPLYRGTTPLIAAMRAFVASRLGDDVEIPEELK